MASGLNVLEIFKDSSIASSVSSHSIQISTPHKPNLCLVACVFNSSKAFSRVNSLSFVGKSFSRKTQSLGVEIWELANAPQGVYNENVEIEFDSTYNVAVVVLVCNICNLSTPLDSFGLNAQITGEPSITLPSANANSFIFDAVRMDEVDISADGSQVEVLNLSFGSGATKQTYGCSYLATGSGGSRTMSWTRSPATNKPWAICCSDLEAGTQVSQIINS